MNIKSFAGKFFKLLKLVFKYHVNDFMSQDFLLVVSAQIIGVGLLAILRFVVLPTRV